MKIVAAIRSYNEAERIEKCCQAFQFCDAVLIADGGSTDGTVKIAIDQPKTKVRDYPVKVQCKNGIWRNPDGAHINFLWDWAREEGADWIISQDCDQRPNKFLKEQARQIMETTTKNFIMPVQIYLWKKTQYFPDMSYQNNNWMHGIWAHRANLGMRVVDKMPHYEFTIDPVKTNDFTLVEPPACYLHCGWEDDVMIEKMIYYYRNSGLIEGQKHPLHFCGKPKELESWMIEF